MGSNDYQVTEQTRQVWRVELDLAQTLLNICKEHGLKIWACFGTLLGAARHNGFIPWDDDIDFVMMREDFDRLWELAKTVPLPEHYEFDTTYVNCLKLRNSNTAMITPYHRLDVRQNQGIWVDVFCLDVAPDDMERGWQAYCAEKDRVAEDIARYNEASGLYYAYKASAKKAFRHFYCRAYVAMVGYERLRRRIGDKLRADGKRFSGRYVWNFMFSSLLYYFKDIKRLDASWFSETVMLPFEDIELPCPAGWEAFLDGYYGDWRTPVMDGGLHHCTVVDPDRSYRFYVKDRLAKMPWWKRFWFQH